MFYNIRYVFQEESDPRLLRSNICYPEPYRWGLLYCDIPCTGSCRPINTTVECSWCNSYARFSKLSCCCMYSFLYSYVPVCLSMFENGHTLGLSERKDRTLEIYYACKWKERTPLFATPNYQNIEAILTFAKKRKFTSTSVRLPSTRARKLAKKRKFASTKIEKTADQSCGHWSLSTYYS
jgi:hypothetical protein